MKLESSEIEETENAICGFFQKRYVHLLSLRRRTFDLKWKLVIKEMEKTLTEYKEKSKNSSLDCLENNKKLLKSGKLSANCISVACAMFCEKFQKFQNTEIEISIDNITEEFRLNVSSFLPYISKNILAIRMVELMLYSICTLREGFIHNQDAWCSLAVDCFHHKSSSKEIKLSSLVLLCYIDKEKQYIDVSMFKLLDKTLLNDDYLGFQEKDIKLAKLRVQDRFQTNFLIKDCNPVPRDSGYKSQDELETKKKIQNSETVKKQQKCEGTQKSQDKVMLPNNQGNFLKKVMTSSFHIVLGIFISILLFWIFRK